MEKEQTKIDQSTQSQCNRLKKDIEMNNGSLDTLRKQRAEVISKQEWEKLKTITTAISQLEDDNEAFEAQRRKFGCADQQTSLGGSDNQTVIATSVVRRKDAKALEIIKKSTVSSRN